MEEALLLALASEGGKAVIQIATAWMMKQGMTVDQIDTVYQQAKEELKKRPASALPDPK